MTATNLQSDVRCALEDCAGRLVNSRTPGGWFEGRLSSSALASALAVFALWMIDKQEHRSRIERGLDWLAANVNPDGGYGDTPESPSNLSTTLLVLSCLRSAGFRSHAGLVRTVEQRVCNETGSLEPARISSAVADLYGRDRTFSAPILTVAALSGILGAQPECWQHVPQLPFELVAAPRRLFSSLRLQVVSYALPALVAIGLARHARTHDFSPMRPVRSALRMHAMRLLTRIQPANGGFLEATPLTAFVTAGLAAAGLHGHEVVKRGVGFLESSMRTDGSWPIDTNLATWLTTLSVNALDRAGILEKLLSEGERRSILQWLVDQQHSQRHPYTGAAGGGWAWTDLAGGVPDADDTAGALLAAAALAREIPNTPARAMLADAPRRGLLWLLDLQNRDGGMPTFCRGWGRLPFDRSCPDITAHALAAFRRWRPHIDCVLGRRMDRALLAGAGYLNACRGADGSWLPLWFGNQLAPDQANPTYGTARVVSLLADADMTREAAGGCRWLAAAANKDGSWGGAQGVSGTIEETALAVGALAAAGYANSTEARKGVCRLIELTARPDLPAAAIGLYFASLWYSESLYPLIFATEALGRMSRCTGVHIFDTNTQNP